jgi:hypothetical protein
MNDGRMLTSFDHLAALLFVQFSDMDRHVHPKSLSKPAVRFLASQQSMPPKWIKSSMGFDFGSPQFGVSQPP